MVGSALRGCRPSHPPPEGVARTPRLRRGVGTGRGGTAPATARADGDDDAGRPGGIGGIVGLRGFVETPDSPIDFRRAVARRPLRPSPFSLAPVGALAER